MRNTRSLNVQPIMDVKFISIYTVTSDSSRKQTNTIRYYEESSPKVNDAQFGKEISFVGVEVSVV
jgi:hypothetical protein